MYHPRADSVIKGGTTLRANLLGNTPEKFRSLSVIKERPSQTERGMSQTPMIKQESGSLPKIDYTPVLGNPLIN
jgi:hypothetical protein